MVMMAITIFTKKSDDDLYKEKPQSLQIKLPIGLFVLLLR